MIVAVDVHYGVRAVTTAAVGFAAWTDARAAFEEVVGDPTPPRPYQPGEFYQRELPYLLTILATVTRRHPIATVVIDAHVWLDGGRPGLGAHLYRALDGRLAVVGVAKSAFRGAPAIAVVRGTSKQPLYVSAAGLVPPEAAARIAAMHGPHRIPTLIKRADSLARERW